MTFPAPRTRHPSWRFSTDVLWTAAVAAVPSEDHRAAYFEAAVPALAASGWHATSGPLIVIGHLSARTPSGPPGRAKTFLDALHDDRRTGQKYAAFGVPAPLAGDDPSHVAGLAIEMGEGGPGTEYQIGTELHIDGQLLASVPVPCSAPNDIAGTAAEQVKIAASRVAFGRAVREAFAQHQPLSPLPFGAVVVRHHPQRDEDNTWQTWIIALCGAAQRSRPDHWSDSAPLAGWRPQAVASLADSRINTPVCYELWG
jgi:hypothetical protein